MNNPVFNIGFIRPEKSYDEAPELYLSLAYAVAASGHEGVINKDGSPYITHPLRLCARWQALPGCMRDIGGEIVSLMHDVIEDTDITAEQLLGLGFPEFLIDSIKRLTMPSSSHCTTLKEREAHYLEHIVQLIDSGDDWAIRTKFFDLEDNMDMTRLTEVGEWELAREAKYHKAYLMVKEALL